MQAESRSEAPSWEIIIVGAGPAGLSAALTLGRCQRRVFLCDRGTPRNWAAKEMHGFLSRDVITPKNFSDICLEELRQYPSVNFKAVEALSAKKTARGFAVSFSDGETKYSKKLLLATGVFDVLPEIPGIEPLFGKSVFQCPYCDGWEMRGQPIAAYGAGSAGLEMALALTAWSNDIILCTNGPARLSKKARLNLAANKIEVFEGSIKWLHSEQEKLLAVEFEDGMVIERSAIFFNTPSKSQSSLAQALGCQFNKKGGIRCGRYEATNIPGLYVAGNIIKDFHLSIAAAAEGAKAAFGINKALTKEALL